MRTLILSLCLVIALSGIANVAQTPLPSIIKGTSSKFYLDEKSAKDYYFKSVQSPDFVTISTDGVISYSQTQKTGAYPVEVKIYDKNSGESQSRQYILKVIDKASQENIWALTSDNYYARKTDNKPLKIVFNENSVSAAKVGQNFKSSFITENGKGELVYAYIGLPDGITANRKTGELTGKFTEPGIYNFGFEVSDQSANSAQGFLAVTVQGKTQTPQNKGQMPKNKAQNLQVKQQNSQGKAQSVEVKVQIIEGNGQKVSNNVQLPNKVTFKLNLPEINKEQIAANRQLYEALAAVNAAKAKLEGRSDNLKKLQSDLNEADALTDKAANNAARAKTERERAAERLRIASNALNDAQDNLNLALLEQAASAEAVTFAQKALDDATKRFNHADAALKNAEAKVQQAEVNMNACKQNLLRAENNLKSAKKQFDRASQDLIDAKDDLEKSLRRKQLGDVDINKAKDAFKLAEQAYNDANKLLDNAGKVLADADLQRQKCLSDLVDAKNSYGQAKNILKTSEWDLERFLSLLYQAQARKEAADRATALALAQGATYVNGSRPLFRSLGGWGKDTSSTGSYIIQAPKDFGGCGKSTYPRFTGSAKITTISSGIATLSTGQQFTYGTCTTGLKNLKLGAEILIDGVVNVDKKVIEAYAIKNAAL